MLKKFFSKNISSNEDFLEALLADKFNKDVIDNAFASGKIDLNYKDKSGNSFLNNAIINSNKKAIKWLLNQKNYDITLENNKGQRSFELAILNDDDKTLRKILEKDIIDINEKDRFGRIILQDLVVTGNVKLAKTLIEYGADINSQDKHHRNVIFDALSFGDKDFITYLLDLDEPKIELNNIDDELNTVMHHNEVLTNDDLAKKFIESGADTTIKNIKGETFLCKTALRGVEVAELVELAIKQGADVNTRTRFDNTIFMELLNVFSRLSSDEVQRRKNLLEMSKLIIAYGGDIDAVNSDNETALFTAVRANDFELVSFLLTTGTNPNVINKYGDTVLLEVIYKGVGSLDILLLMLENKADPLIRNIDGKTIYEVLNDIILHVHEKKFIENQNLIEKINLSGQYMVLLKELLKHNKADLNFLDSTGNPLFFNPLLYDDGDLFRLYINNGLNIHTLNKQGYNIFFAYVLKVFEDNTTNIDFQDNLSRLISKKVNQNAQDSLGWTVIHKILSTKCNDTLFSTLTKVVKFDLKITDNLGRSVIHNAVWSNNKRMIKRLNQMDHELINMDDIYGLMPVTYAALLGSQDLVLLFIDLKAHMKGGHNVPPNAIKKFSPMIKNLPKIKENIQNSLILEKMDALIEQIQIDFEVPDSLMIH